MYTQQEFDIVLLDIMLPDMSGFEVLRTLRTSSDVAIIMLTAKWEIEDKEQGFLWWADDYLVKPFELRELWLRIQSVLQRKNTSDIIHVWDLFINMQANTVSKNYVTLSLSQTEWLILSLLVIEQWQAVSRASLIDHVWWAEDMYSHSRSLDVHIARLRQKIWKTYIQTVTWFGYRLETNKNA